jgi:hypothetical protein
MVGPDFDFKATLNYDHDVPSAVGYCLYTTLVVGNYFINNLLFKNI